MHAGHVLEARLGSHRAVSDDVRHFLLAVFLGDPVEDFVSSLIVEIDIYIGQGDTVGVEETLEQEVVLEGIDVGDFQAVGHHGTGRGSTSRTHGDAHAAGRRDEVLHDEEVAGEAHVAHHTELELDALQYLGIDGVAVPLHRALHSELVQVVGLQLDTIDALQTAQLLDTALAAFAALELGAEVLLRESLLVALHGAELLGNLEHRHDGGVLQGVSLHLVHNLLCVGQRLGHIGEDGLHLLGGLQPFLLGVVQTVGVIEFLAGAEANEPVVGLAIVLVHEVHVVGGDDLDASFGCQAQDAFVGHLLLLIDSAVTTGLIGLMSLYLKIIVVAEDALEPERGILGFLVLAVGDVARHLAGETRGGDNQPLVVLLQQFTVDAGLVVLAVDPA